MTQLDHREASELNAIAGIHPAHRLARYAFLGAATVFAACVAAQVFLAGLATFATPVHWAQHRSFVHLFGFVPALMLALSLVGRLPARLRWQSAALWLLIFAQYATANIGGRAPLAAALHPVLALALFWLAAEVVRQGWRALGYVKEQGR
ncbi:MAG TPA: DUF6220 domain-containing protein [Roseiflexaceae bacterium]|nr:DUF6220 domain-containing protein [Roseiflexaceae bacterium]